MTAKLIKNQGSVNKLLVEELSNDVNQVIDRILQKKSIYAPRTEREVSNKNVLTIKPLKL